MTSGCFVASSKNGFLKRNNIDSPLLIQLIAELYLNDKKIQETFNKYSLYEQIVEKKIEIIDEKGKIVSQDRDNRKSKITIWEIHQIYALKLLFCDGCKDGQEFKKMNINELPLIKRWNKSNEKSKWKPEQISRYGFLIVDNWNTEEEFPDFSHRTFAEFFTAQYFIGDLYELDEDDDSLSNEDIEMRVKLFINLTMNERLMEKFTESFIESHNQKKIGNNFFKFITSDEMGEFIFNHIEDDEKLLRPIKFFGLDERFLKEFRYKNETIFQLLFQHYINPSSCFRIFFIEIIKIYEQSLGPHWMNYTGYVFTGELLNDDELDKKFHYLWHKLMYQLFYFINHAEIPQKHLSDFFKRNLAFIIDLLMIDFELFNAQFFEIIETKFCDCKNEFKEIFKNFNPKMALRILFKVDDVLASQINEVFERLKLFPYPDDFKVTRAFKNARTHAFLRCFKFKYFINFYKKEPKYFSQLELQEYFIENSVLIVAENYDMRQNLESYLNEIFLLNQNEEFSKIQIRKFLTNRQTITNNDNEDFLDYNVHSILSYFKSEIKRDLGNAENLEKSVKNYEYLYKLAREVGLSDDDIKRLSSQ